MEVLSDGAGPDISQVKRQTLLGHVCRTGSDQDVEQKSFKQNGFNILVV